MKKDVRFSISPLKIAQCICHRVASGLPVTEAELQFSFDMAEQYGDDAVWQQ